MASNGQGCPCLDLSRLPRELCQAAQSADLVILEGMGRAILTNFQARFSVAALKVCCGCCCFMCVCWAGVWCLPSCVSWSQWPSGICAGPR